VLDVVIDGLAFDYPSDDVSDTVERSTSLIS